MNIVVTMQSMNSFLADTFWALVNQGCQQKAIEFLSMVPFHIPTSEILNYVVYKLLLNSRNRVISFKAFKYIDHLMTTCSPDVHMKFYHNALFFYHKEEIDMWDMFSNLIERCIKNLDADFQLQEDVHCDINEDNEDVAGSLDDDYDSKNNIHQNISSAVGVDCFLLIKYFINFFVKEFSDKKNMVVVDDISSSWRQFLFPRLIWSKGDIGRFNSNCRCLLGFINDIFHGDVTGLRLKLLRLLQKLICLIIDYCQNFIGCSDVDPLYLAPFAEIYQAVLSCCYDVTHDVDNLKLFLAGISTTWLKIKICEGVIVQIKFNYFLCFDDQKRVSLRKIISQYIMQENCSIAENTKEKGNCLVGEKVKLEVLLKNHETSMKDLIGKVIKIEDNIKKYLEIADKKEPLHVHTYSSAQIYLYVYALQQLITNYLEIYEMPMLWKNYKMQCMPSSSDISSEKIITKHLSGKHKIVEVQDITKCLDDLYVIDALPLCMEALSLALETCNFDVSVQQTCLRLLAYCYYC